ncbi:outer membrane protein [Paracoccus mangrovi]|uniref:Outer membrane protein n=1 Tax=Paracoccus mangrovi TaxID=1715645 RepID=A0ABV7R2S7_9RHOB
MKNLAILTFATLISAQGAAAADGFYLKGSISNSNIGHEIERNTGGTTLPVPDVGGVSRTEIDDLGVGIGIGYQRALGVGDMFWGAELFYNVETGESRNINGVLSTKIDHKATYGARALLGTKINEKVAVYGHAGVARVEFDVRNTYTFAPPVRDKSFEETGFIFGFGAEYALTDRVAVFADYSRITDIDFGGIPEVAGGTNRSNPNKLDFDKISIGAKFTF